MGSLCGLEGNEEGTSSVLGVGLVEGAQGLTLRPQRPLQLIPSLRYAAPCNAVMPLQPVPTASANQLAIHAGYLSDTPSPSTYPSIQF